MPETRKQPTGWFARWRERRRQSARKAAEVQVRMDEAHRKHLGGKHSDPRGPGERGGGMGGI